MNEHSQHDNQGSGGGGAGRYVFWGFLVIAGYFLIMEHSAHVVQYLPYLLLLACPLMHLLHGHGGHGGHGGGDSTDKSGKVKKSETPIDAAPGSQDSGTGQHHH